MDEPRLTTTEELLVAIEQHLASIAESLHDLSLAVDDGFKDGARLRIDVPGSVMTTNGDL